MCVEWIMVNVCHAPVLLLLFTGHNSAGRELEGKKGDVHMCVHVSVLLYLLLQIEDIYGWSSQIQRTD